MFAPWTFSGPDWSPEGGWFDNFKHEAEHARALGKAVLEHRNGWEDQLRDALHRKGFMASLGPVLTARGRVRFQIDMPHIRPIAAVSLGVSMILSKHGLRERIVRTCCLVECGKLFYSLAQGRPPEYCMPKHRQRAMTLAYDVRFSGHELHEKQLRAIPARSAKHK
jgi:hypothetical protein